MRQIILKIIETGGAKIYAVFLGILTITVTARWLGVEGRGIYATVMTWVMIFVELSNMSLGSALMYHATKHRDDGWLGRTLGNLLLFTAITTLVSWVIVALLYVAGNQWGFVNVIGPIPIWPLVVGFLILPFAIWEHYTQALFNIEDNLRRFNRYQIFGSTSNSILIVLLVIVLEVGVIGALISALVWYCIVAIGGVRDLWRIAGERVAHTGKVVSTNINELKLVVKDGFKAHFNILGTMMLLNIDIVMVNAYLGVEQTGIYQLAVQASQLMLIISYAGMTVLQGEATRVGVYGVWTYQKKILAMTFGVMLVACTTAAFSADWWLILLAGEEFSPSVIVFQLLMFSILEHTITNMLSVQWIARGLLWQLSALSLSKGILNIVLNMILIPKYGLLGAVWATLGVAAYSTLINTVVFIYFEYDVRKHFAKKETSS